MKYFTKKILFIIIIFFSIAVNSQETYSKIIYKKKSSIDLEKTKSKNTDAIKLLYNVFEKMNELEYILLFKNKKSIFKEILKLNKDEEENSLSTKLSKSMGNSEGIYFTNQKNNKIYHQIEFENELFLVESKINSDWKLTQETKKIGKYLCYKAIKKDYYIGSSGNKIKKQIIAWYTTEIPFGYGPLKYNGLPGLILELTNNKTIFYAKEIHLNIKKNIDIRKPKRGLEITHKRYDSIVMGLAKDFRKSIRN